MTIRTRWCQHLDVNVTFAGVPSIYVNIFCYSDKASGGGKRVQMNTHLVIKNAFKLSSICRENIKILMVVV